MASSPLDQLLTSLQPTGSSSTGDPVTSNIPNAPQSSELDKLLASLHPAEHVYMDLNPATNRNLGPTGVYNTTDDQFINRDKEVTNSTWRNMWNSFKRGIDEIQISTAQGKFEYSPFGDSAGSIIDNYPDQLKDLQSQLDRGIISQAQFDKNSSDLNGSYQKALQAKANLDQTVQDNNAEIANEPVSKQYEYKNWLIQQSGSEGSLWDKTIYTMPQILGSSASLMIPQLAATFGTNITKALISTAATELAGPEVGIPVQGIATVGAIAASIAEVVWGRTQESYGEVGGNIMDIRSKLTEDYLKAHPNLQGDATKIPEEDQRQIRIQSRKGSDGQFWENMALSVSDIAQAIIMPGSALGNVVEDTFGGLGKVLKEAGDYNRITRALRTIGETYYESLGEKFEEGFQQAAQYRATDEATGANIYTNKGLMSDILTDAYDTASSLNYSLIPGITLRADGRYSQDKEFQFAEDSGGMLGILMGAIPASISISKDLLAYRRATKALAKQGAINPDDKIFRLQDSILKKYFDKDQVQYLVEAMRSVKGKKDENNQDIYGNNFEPAIQNIKKAYAIYDGVSSRIEDLRGDKWGFFTSKELSQAKEMLKEDLFHNSMSTIREQAKLSDLNQSRDEISNREHVLSGDDESTNQYKNILDQLELAKSFKETNSRWLDSNLDLIPGMSEKDRPSLERKNEFLTKEISRLQKLSDRYKEQNQGKQVSEASTELTRANQTSLVSAMNLADIQSQYNELLKIKDYKAAKDYYAKQRLLRGFATNSPLTNDESAEQAEPSGKNDQSPDVVGNNPAYEQEITSDGYEEEVQSGQPPVAGDSLMPDGFEEEIIPENEGQVSRNLTDTFANALDPNDDRDIYTRANTLQQTMLDKGIDLAKMKFLDIYNMFKDSFKSNSNFVRSSFNLLKSLIQEIKQPISSVQELTDLQNSQIDFNTLDLIGATAKEYNTPPIQDINNVATANDQIIRSTQEEGVEPGTGLKIVSGLSLATSNIISARVGDQVGDSRESGKIQFSEQTDQQLVNTNFVKLGDEIELRVTSLPQNFDKNLVTDDNYDLVDIQVFKTVKEDSPNGIVERQIQLGSLHKVTSLPRLLAEKSDLQTEMLALRNQRRDIIQTGKSFKAIISNKGFGFLNKNNRALQVPIQNVFGNDSRVHLSTVAASGQAIETKDGITYARGTTPLIPGAVIVFVPNETKNGTLYIPLYLTKNQIKINENILDKVHDSVQEFLKTGSRKAMSDAERYTYITKEPGETSGLSLKGIFYGYKDGNAYVNINGKRFSMANKTSELKSALGQIYFTINRNLLKDDTYTKEVMKSGLLTTNITSNSVLNQRQDQYTFLDKDQQNQYFSQHTIELSNFQLVSDQQTPSLRQEERVDNITPTLDIKQEISKLRAERLERAKELGFAYQDGKGSMKSVYDEVISWLSEDETLQGIGTTPEEVATANQFLQMYEAYEARIEKLQNEIGQTNIDSTEALHSLVGTEGNKVPTEGSDIFSLPITPTQSTQVGNTIEGVQITQEENKDVNNALSDLGIGLDFEDLGGDIEINYTPEYKNNLSEFIGLKETGYRYTKQEQQEVQRKLDQFNKTNNSSHNIVSSIKLGGKGPIALSLQGTFVVDDISTGSSSLESKLIVSKDISATLQNQMVDSIAYMLLTNEQNEISNKDKILANLNKKLNGLRDLLTKPNTAENLEKIQTLVNNYSLMTTHYDGLYSKAIEVLEGLGFESRNESSDYFENLEANQEDNNTTQFNDDSNSTRNQKNFLPSEVKKLLYFIPNLQLRDMDNSKDIADMNNPKSKYFGKNYKAKLNSLGLESFNDFNDTWEKTMSIISQRTYSSDDSGFNQILEQLQRDSNPIIVRELAQRVGQANDQVKNAFFRRTYLQRQQNKTTIVNYKNNRSWQDQYGVWHQGTTTKTTQIINSDQRQGIRFISNQLESEFRINGPKTGIVEASIEEATGRSIYKINIQKGKELHNQVRDLIANKENYEVERQAIGNVSTKYSTRFTTKAKNDLLDIVRQLGIQLSYQGLNDLLKFYKPANSQGLGDERAVATEIFQNTIFKRLAGFSGTTSIDNQVQSEEEVQTDTDYETNNPFKKDISTIQTLARFEAPYRIQNQSGSYRAGGKSYYPFTRHSYLSEMLTDMVAWLRDRVRGQSAEKNVFAKLRTDRFAQQSKYLNAIANPVSNPEFAKIFKLRYELDTRNRAALDSTGKQLQAMTEREHQISKLTNFQNSGNKAATFYYDTLSDKITMPVIDAPRQYLGYSTMTQSIDQGNIQLDGITMDNLYKYFLAEYNRIKDVVHQNKSLEKYEKIKGYHDIGSKEGMGKIFNIYYFLNKDVLAVDNPTLAKNLFGPNGEVGELTTSLEEMIKGEINSHFNKLFIKTKADFKSLELFNLENKNVRKEFDPLIQDIVDAKYLQKNKEILGLEGIKGLNRGEYYKLTPEQLTRIVDHAIIDYVTNYSIFSNEMLMFTGDPAQAGKLTDEDTIKSIKKQISDPLQQTKAITIANVIATFVNVGKRNAAFLGSGEKGKFMNSSYKVAIANDISIKSPQFEQYKTLFKGNEAAIEKSYNNGDLTDAQEVTTVEEHLHTMMAFGQINNQQYKKFLWIYDRSHYNQLYPNSSESISAKDRFEAYGMVMQPMKPVQRTYNIDDQLHISKQYYIKTSSYPLVPDMVKGTPLEDLMNDMKRQGIQRVAFVSATKQGVTGASNIFNSDGNYSENFLDNNQNQLDRDGFRIQLEVPYKDKKDAIREGTQLAKLIFVDIPEVLQVTYQGKQAKIGELKQKYVDYHKQIVDVKTQELLDELGAKRDFRGRPIIKNLAKLARIIQEEGIDRGYSINALLGLDLNSQGQFKIPLTFLPNVGQIEPVLTAIVSNRIARLKMPGKSYVQGSEFVLNTGKGRVSTLENTKLSSSGIISTNRKGIDYLYNQNTQLSKIGTKEQYSRYLETIFPNSKMKDIVYHGSPVEGIETFDSSLGGTNTGVESATKGIFFSDNIDVAEVFGKWKGILTSKSNIYPALINTSKPYIGLEQDSLKDSSGKTIKTTEQLRTEQINNAINQGNDSVILGENKGDKDIVVVFNPDKVHILGSESDLNNFRKFTSSSVNTDQRNIVWTKPEYSGTSKLKYLREENGKVLPAQIIMPFYFIDPKTHKRVSLETYTTKDDEGRTILDLSKIDSELLEMNGFRIPFQGHNSGMWFEIIGFLPYEMGDLVLVPGEIAAQMGSDYDVDKLYSYMYNYSVNSDQSIRKISSSEQVTEGEQLTKYSDESVEDYEQRVSDSKVKGLQNSLIDIHKSIFTSRDMFQSILDPLSFADVEEAITELGSEESKEFLGAFDPGYQRDVYFSNRGGQLGVGITANANTSHAMAQSTNLFIKGQGIVFLDEQGRPYIDKGGDGNGVNETNDRSYTYSEDGKSINQNNGEQHSAWRLDKINTFTTNPSTNKPYKISNLISQLLGVSVDNAKEQKLGAYGLNKHNFNVAITIVRSGFDLKITKAFINQPILKEYYNVIGGTEDMFALDFTSNKREQVVKDLFKKYGERYGIDYNTIFNNNNLTGFTMAEMKTSLDQGIVDQTNAEQQLRILKAFLHYKNLSDGLQALTSALNTDTKGLPKNVSETVAKTQDISDNVTDNLFFGNTYNFFNSTIPGVFSDIPALFQSLFVNPENPIFAYSSPAYVSAMNQIQFLTGRQILTQEKLDTFHNAIKQFLYTSSMIKTFEGDIDQKRSSLLFDNENNKSLQTKYLELIAKYPQNDLLRAITPIISEYINDPKLLEIPLSSEEDYTEKIRQYWEYMLNDSDQLDLQDFAKDLVNYSLLISSQEYGSSNLIKYIPFSYLQSIGFGNALNKINQDLFAEDSDVLNAFAYQLIQHNQDFTLAAREKNFTKGSIIYQTVTTIYKGKNVINNTNIINKFSLEKYHPDTISTNPAASLLREDQDGNWDYPETLSVFIDSNIGKLLYQKKQNANGSVDYYRVDKLGTNNVFEFNFNALPGFTKSIFEGNNSDIEFPPSNASTKTFEGKVAPEQSEDLSLADKYFPKGKEVTIQRLLDKVTGNLSKIGNNTTALSYFSLATAISGYKLNTPISINENLKTRAATSSIDNIVQGIVFNPTVLFVKDRTGVGAELDGIRTILHELVHVLTLDQIRSSEFQKSPEFKQLNSIWEEYRDTIRSQSKTKVRGINSNVFDAELFSLLKSKWDTIKMNGSSDIYTPNFRETISKLLNNSEELNKFLGELGRNFQQLADQGKIDKANYNLTSNTERLEAIKARMRQFADNFEDNINKYYAYYDISEFVTEAMTNVKTQEDLRKIPSIWNRLRSIIANILAKILGYDKNDRSLLDDAIDSIMDVVSTKFESSSEDNIVEESPQNQIEELKTNTEQDFHISRIYRLPSGKVITFNDQQYDGLKVLDTFLKSENTIASLEGYAGTGKSTIVKALLDQYRGTVGVTAPTHKAKNVISKMTNRQAITVQKLLGLRPNTDLENFDPAKPVFDPLAPATIAGLDLVILDEASMLNKALFNLLVQKAKESNTKIIFMGDNAQIPPVGEQKSDVFTSDKVNVRHKLDKVERQANSNPLMSVYDTIRRNISSKEDQFDHKTKLNKNGEGIEFTKDENKFYSEVVKLFKSSEYSTDRDFAKIIAYTNDAVTDWNYRIRRALFGINARQFEEGDTLMAYDNVNIDRLSIENSSEYIVKNVLEKQNYGSYDMDGFLLKIKSTDEYGSENQIFIIKNTSDQIEKYKSVYRRLLTEAKASKRWKAFYNFKGTYMLSQPIFEGRELIANKTFDYGYAITSHKSQGSTYTHSLILEDNIDKQDDAEQKNKMKYVAFSRPTTRVLSLSRNTIDEGTNFYIEHDDMTLSLDRDINSIKDSELEELKKFCK